MLGELAQDLGGLLEAGVLGLVIPEGFGVGEAGHQVKGDLGEAVQGGAGEGLAEGLVEVAIDGGDGRPDAVVLGLSLEEGLRLGDGFLGPADDALRSHRQPHT